MDALLGWTGQLMIEYMGLGPTFTIFTAMVAVGGLVVAGILRKERDHG